MMFHERTVNQNKFPNGKKFWQQKYRYNRSISKIHKNEYKMMSSSKISNGSRHVNSVRGSVCQTKIKEDFVSTSQNYLWSLFWFL